MRPGARFDGWDAACVAVLGACWFFALVWHYEEFPIQPWDESRNVLNAMAMADGKGWLVTVYDGAPDHWSLKPPLIIWCMAGLMRLGVPLLLSVRLPVFVAALLTLGLVWAVPRYALRDRLGGMAGALLLCTSTLYMGIHSARTGDYEGLLALFTLCGVLAFWRAVAWEDGVRIGWLAASGGAFVLAVLTKGIAGVFAPAGLVVFAAVTGRLGRLFRDWRVWAVGLASVGFSLLYYVVREAFDPGYVRLVWEREVGPRVVSVFEEHAEPVYFYFAVLGWRYPLGVALLPAAGFAAGAADARRRALAQCCLLAAGCFFLVITVAVTKLLWYPAAIVPLFALATGLGVADLLRWVGGRWRVPAMVGVLAVLVVGAARVVVSNQVHAMRAVRAADKGQYYYDSFFQRLEREQGARRIIVPDSGTTHFSGPAGYDPLLRIAAALAARRGVQVAPVGPATVPSGVMVATCDPDVIPQLSARPGFAVSLRDRWCIAGRQEG